jgi:4-hydroxy-3-polyprenylbenzoate decarboxylase
MADKLVVKKRIIVAMTGASGAIYGIRILEILHDDPLVETHLVISPAAHITILHETDRNPEEVLALADIIHNYDDIGASIASGSYNITAMIVAPCSIKTLSGISNSYTDNLISRAADVQLKEGRPLVLMVRETPLHLGHLRLMTQAAEIGAIIMPPIPSWYSKPSSIDDVINDIVFHALRRLGFDNLPHYQWEGIPPP